jgi:serine/threonine protein kinase
VSRAAAEVGSTANSYQILAKLATGGMAEIFLARGEGVAGVERYCVLKRILRDRASDVHFVQMFLDEARLAAQLQHPNIAQVYDIGKLGDSFFFTMEYVHGETVRALLHRSLGLRRKLPIASVLTIVAGAAAGLHHAHVRVGVDGRALDIVHRDVSPSNLMVSYEGGVKLVDFGVAKASDRAHETKSGTVKGKISYLSPEQCRGKRVDRRSDLFSLGICFWEMLTCERLYRRDSDFENMNAIAGEPPPAPSSRRSDVPPELDDLVLRLLAKEPEGRCQTAEELIEAVEGVAARTGTVLSASGLGRFMRELFGQRPEPWLELESLQEQGEAVSVTSEPIPPELAVPPADRIDHQLASVLDLSQHRSITESLDERQVIPVLPAAGVRAVEPTAPLGKSAKRGFPLAAPPPTLTGIEPTPSPSPSPPSSSSPSGMRPLAGWSSGSRPRRPPTPDVFTASSAIALPAPPEAPSGTRALVLADLEPVVAAQGSTSGGRALPLPAPGSPAEGASAASASFAAISISGTPSLPSISTSGSIPGLSAAPRVTPSGPFSALPEGAGARRAWPLIAFITGAALVGSLAVVFLMRSGSQAAAVAGRRAIRPSAVAAAGAPASAEPAHNQITVEPIEPERVRPPAAAPGAESPVAPWVAPSPAPSAASADAAMPAEAAPVASAAIHAPSRTHAPGRSSGPRTVWRGAHSSDKHEPSPPIDDVPQLYASGAYDKVVAACTGMSVSGDRTPMCFLAACHTGDAVAAHRLLAAVPAARREQLALNCRQLGVEVDLVDCEADPMSCQH